MNREAMHRILSLAIAPLVLILAGCGAAPLGPSTNGVDLRGSNLGGDFELTDKTGRTVHWDDFAGRYRIVYFGYTWCPDICPTDVQRMTQGLRLFAREHPALAKKIQPIFITVDPERDTPAKVGEFAAAFHPDLIGLTGTREQIEAAKTAFKAFSRKGETQPNGGYLVDHSNLAYLFAPDGKPLGTLPTDKGPEAVAAELAGWVR
ncbi:SCO family protein [Qipengyuania sediminis]|uniref:SCO family protein n=1 Tax=Qipengyuania sediminis TaxID=1532023 RepID=UPI001059A7E8|nr:SCO family protein [Qipengyuania sediminis]